MLFVDICPGQTIADSLNAVLNRDVRRDGDVADAEALKGFDTRHAAAQFAHAGVVRQDVASVDVGLV